MNSMEADNKQVVITDGWHPTINPSSRMPIHHHRFIELLNRHNGILNEFPRQYGGNTLRAMHIDRDGRIAIFKLNKALKYMPWWLSATSDKAITLITGIVTEAIANSLCISTPAYRVLLETYLELATGNSQKTFGEVLCQTNNFLYSKIYPELPKVILTSLTRLQITHLLANGLQNLSDSLFEIFNLICSINDKEGFGFLGVLTSYNDVSWRLTYEAGKNELSITTINKPHLVTKVHLDTIVHLLDLGQFLPSSQLLIAIEFSLTVLGYSVIHYGNAYNRHEIFASASGLPNTVTYWEDDCDSWNFAMLKGANNIVYPIHLLDLLCLGDEANDIITKLISQSLEFGKPIIVNTKKGTDGSLLETLSY